MIQFYHFKSSHSSHFIIFLKIFLISFLLYFPSHNSS
nr:MAG TPA: hypothetical protein [Caudoviricetes sp.]